MASARSRIAVRELLFGIASFDELRQLLERHLHGSAECIQDQVIVDLADVGFLGAVRLDDLLCSRFGLFTDELVHLVREIDPCKDLVALSVDDLALLVEHVVVVEKALACIEVVGFDLLLGHLDGLGEKRVIHRHRLLDLHHLEDTLDAVAAEDTQNVVFGRQEELRFARIPLPAGTVPGAGCRCGATHGARSRG